MPEQVVSRARFVVGVAGYALSRVAARSQVTAREALVIGALGVLYVTLGAAGGLLLAVYA